MLLNAILYLFYLRYIPMGQELLLYLQFKE